MEYGNGNFINRLMENKNLYVYTIFYTVQNYTQLYTIIYKLQLYTIQIVYNNFEICAMDDRGDEMHENISINRK